MSEPHPASDGPDFNRLVSRLRMRHFELLNCLGRDPNLGRTAAAMNLAQSTVTKMLQDVEAVVETPLFQRNRRGLTPTAAGVVLIERAGLILSDLEAGCAELAGIRRGANRLVRLGAFPVVAPDFLPRLCARLTGSAPGARIVVEEGDEVRLTDRLSSGALDAVIGRIAPERIGPDLVQIVLYREETFVVCGPNNPIMELSGPELLARMAAVDWILPTSRGGAFALVSALLIEAGHAAPRVAIQSIAPLATVGLLRRSELLAVLPSGLAQSFCASGAVKVLSVKLSDRIFPVGVIYRRALENTEIVRWIVGACRDAGAVQHAGEDAEAVAGV